jgi:hypothetical protein
MTLPYGMQPAPARQPKVSPPIDLGAYDPSYAGWQVIVDLEVPLSALRTFSRFEPQAIPNMGDIDAMSDERKLVVAQAGVQQIFSMQEYLAKTIAAWNFVQTLPNGTVEPLPQPREGGVECISTSLIFLLARAIRDAQTPNKSAAKRSTRRS